MNVFPLPVTQTPRVIILLVHIFASVRKGLLVMEPIVVGNLHIITYTTAKCDSPCSFTGL